MRLIKRLLQEKGWYIYNKYPLTEPLIEGPYPEESARARIPMLRIGDNSVYIKHHWLRPEGSRLPIMPGFHRGKKESQ